MTDVCSEIQYPDQRTRLGIDFRVANHVEVSRRSRPRNDRGPSLWEPWVEVELAALHFTHHGSERSVTKRLTLQMHRPHDVVAGTANHTLIARDTGNVAEVGSALWAKIDYSTQLLLQRRTVSNERFV